MSHPMLAWLLLNLGSLIPVLSDITLRACTKGEQQVTFSASIHFQLELVPCCPVLSYAPFPGPLLLRLCHRVTCHHTDG